MASRVDLKSIKDQIKIILDNCNVVGGDPIDLSSDLTQRVKKILTVNPEMIPIQASFFPCVTCYIDSKSYRLSDISVNQINARRNSNISIKIVGSIWNHNMTSPLEDPADNDINYLMENIELILRSNHTLNGKVLWQKPLDISYYIAQIEEQTHLRAGILTLEASVFY